MGVAATIARGLEVGRSQGALAHVASRVWAACARVDRPLLWRDTAKVVAIGGPTLGGSGKTPLAMACAQELSRRGMNVALVGHAYGASPARAREVCLEDDVEAVGDEALLCARRLASVGVPVFVGRSRQAALDRALASADVVVVDGLCQATPRRATLALLAVDSWAPWGAGYCPPRGDLRASVEKLLFAADRLVAIGDGQEPLSEGQLPVDRVEVLSKGAWFTSQGRRALLDWHTLRSLRVGLWTGVARPDRIVRQLAAQGVYPRETVFDLDHAIVTRNELKASRTRLDLWLMTEKCEANLGARRRRLGVCADVPIATLDHSFRLGSGLLGKLSHLDPSHTRP